MFDCPNGATLSFWFKAPSQSHNWPYICVGTSMNIYSKQVANGLALRVAVNNGTHLLTYQSFPEVSLYKWHLIGITYSLNSGYEVYYDGCKTSEVPQVDPKTPSPKDLQLGCKSVSNCMKSNYDDLRFWTAHKSPKFMFWLWNMWRETQTKNWVDQLIKCLAIAYTWRILH